ncbi:hypothetical protein CPB84DRAFT_1749802 [Gymnopilus junonius]|uniref:Uncharacterized protein n=1 Tax=Gymnopilus junonius TaxID=109634 RepID=A0A9P5TJ46_GYMJU|nr:hypothetical protein CPB84DRAFT_1749802 [Gymnopilus junonius]
MAHLIQQVKEVIGDYRIKPWAKKGRQVTKSKALTFAPFWGESKHTSCKHTAVKHAVGVCQVLEQPEASNRGYLQVGLFLRNSHISRSPTAPSQSEDAESSGQTLQITSNAEEDRPTANVLVCGNGLISDRRPSVSRDGGGVPHMLYAEIEEIKYAEQELSLQQALSNERDKREERI